LNERDRTMKEKIEKLIEKWRNELQHFMHWLRRKIEKGKP